MLKVALLFLLSVTTCCQTTNPGKVPQSRFYKAENFTSADYLELRKDGTYQVIAREHVGLMLTERGTWQQNGSAITFRPSSLMKGGKTVNVQQKSYEGTEEKYKDKTFLAFKTEDAPSIVIPSSETKQQLDADNNALPAYVFFKTTQSVFATETKQPYPFRHIKP